jgi:hypothetical protein
MEGNTKRVTEGGKRVTDGLLKTSKNKKLM